MPSIRRRIQTRRSDLAELDEEQVRHLSEGFHFFGGFSDKTTFLEAWQIHGAWITEKWIVERPGTRPFGWWLARGEERPIVNRFMSDEAIQLKRDDPEHFGFLHSHIFGGRGMLPLQEDETDYLERHGLLTEADIEALEVEGD